MQKVKTLKELQKRIQQAKGESGTTAYRPKMKDEQDFMDKHEIELTDDANGNGDEVFKGTSAKYNKRKDERHGYDSPDDQKVHEEVEEIDERELSSGEMKSREKYVKGMKKRLGDFKQRYGADAKSVMYATATKMAKEDFEVDQSTIELLELFVQLDDEHKQCMMEMINDGLRDEILEFLKEESEEDNG